MTILSFALLPGIFKAQVDPYVNYEQEMTNNTEDTEAVTDNTGDPAAMAEDYLAYGAFSKKGLIGQLEYEGFSNDEATSAVESLDVDWKEQAAKKAQEYMDYQDFTKEGLTSQLEYEGFTADEVAFGVSSVGL